MAESLSHTRVLPSEVVDRPWVWYEGDRNPPPEDNVETDTDTKLGKWMLFLNKTRKYRNGLTRLDKAWISVVDLVNEGALYNAKCSTSMETDNSDPREGVVVCYTNDFTNKTQVREAAKAIIDVVSYPKPMFYKTDNATRHNVYGRNGDRNVSMYKYSVEGQMYERGRNNGWFLVRDESLFNVRVIPSQVTDRPWVWHYEWNARPADIENDHDPSIAGKWMLFLDKTDKDSNGLTSLDRAWISVVDLVNEGALDNAKCSTPMEILDYSEHDEEGVVCCYIYDFTNIAKVKEAAKAVRNVVPYPNPMYFKTERTSLINVYLRNGCRYVSFYKYSVDHKMYEKESDEWFSCDEDD